MNLKHLETFHYFCKFLSMTRTAEQLNISQPAVSQQLRGFEDECGVKLFYREDNRYKLTETGESLSLLNKVVFSRVAQMDALLDKARKSTQQRLWIGTSKDYARTIMPDLIAEFQHHFPRVQVRLTEGNSADLVARLRERREDLVVVARPEYDSTLKGIPFERVEFVLVSRPDHPFAKEGTVSIRRLSGESLIIRELGSGSRQAIQKKLQKYGVTPSVVIESGSLSFILGYIERKMGVSFILSHEVAHHLAAGTLKQISLEEGNIGFNSEIVIRRDEPISPPMRYFLKIAKKR